MDLDNALIRKAVSECIDREGNASLTLARPWAYFPAQFSDWVMRSHVLRDESSARCSTPKQLRLRSGGSWFLVVAVRIAEVEESWLSAE